MSNFQVITFDGTKQKRVVSADSVFDFSGIRVGADNLAISQSGSGASAAFDFGGKKLYNVATPGPTDDVSMVATKGYVDAVAAGLDPKEAARLATAAALPACTYANGTSGVGATLTADAFGALSVDGQPVAVGNRILVKNQAAALQNGVYVVTVAGAADANYVLTRATDFDGAPAQEVDGGEYIFVKDGDTNADCGFVLSLPNITATIGVTALVFTQFSAAGTFTAGAGLTKTGTTLDVGAADASIDVQTDAIAVKRDAAGAIGLDTNGIKINVEASTPTLKIASNELGVKYTNGLTAVAGGLTLSLDGSTLALGTGGVKVASQGITATELHADVAGDGLTGGNGSALAVGAGNGISVAANAVAVAADATGGANLAKAINVSSNGVAVKVDDSSIEGDATSGQLKVKALGIATGMIAANAVNASKLNSDVFGAGIVANGTTNAIDINLEASNPTLQIASDALGVKFSNGLMTGASGLTIDLDGSTLAVGVDGLKIPSQGVTATELAAGIAGAGLTGANGSALAVGAGDAISVTADAVAVDFTQSLQADEGVAANDVCYIKANGHVALAKANIDLSAAELVIATATVLSGASGAFVARRGAVVAGFSGLTPGAKYYVSRATAGALVASLSAFVAGEHVYSIGRAKNATEIVYAPQFEFEY
jgi:hypothetical protein